MHTNADPLRSLLTGYSSQGVTNQRQVLRDLIQKLCLLGLWRGGFFEHAAFYGGTALRLLYGLDRFSEDLDFSLLTPNAEFQLDNYLRYVRQELRAWGITAQVALHAKPDSHIESAFIKANTKQTFMDLGMPAAFSKGLHRDELSSVKFELDPEPPCSFETEFRYILEPIPFSVGTMSPSELFAGKMHAVLVRGWQSRVKGRDWYDLIWFVKNSIALNLNHLEARLRQSGHLAPGEPLSESSFREMLEERIRNVDFEKAQADVMSFIPIQDSLRNWNKELFSEVARQILIQ